MNITRSTGGFVGVCALVVAVATGPASLGAREAAKEPQERFKAVAVTRGALTNPAMGRFDIVVSRWSTEADTDRLIAALKEKGQEKMLDTLMKLPRAGFIGFGGDLYYAYKVSTPNDGAQVRVIMDRERSYYEVVNRPKSYDYPFIVIDFHVNADGTGKGTMTVATKMTVDPDGKFIVAENYDTQSVLLDIKRDKP